MLDRFAVTPADDVVHNGPNAALLDGAKKLGYPARGAAMNMRDTAAVSAGWSTLGDRQACSASIWARIRLRIREWIRRCQANKQGCLATYLADALAAGARVHTRVHVDRHALPR